MTFLHLPRYFLDFQSAQIHDLAEKTPSSDLPTLHRGVYQLNMS